MKDHESRCVFLENLVYRCSVYIYIKKKIYIYIHALYTLIHLGMTIRYHKTNRSLDRDISS